MKIRGNAEKSQQCKEGSYYLATQPSVIFSGGACGARAPPEFGGSQKGRSRISALKRFAITMNTLRFEKLNTALHPNSNVNGKPYWIQKNGNNAIWYLYGVWHIGKEVNLGTGIAEIHSTSNDAANPYQVTSWKYISSNKRIIESNDISVWPKKPREP